MKRKTLVLITIIFILLGCKEDSSKINIQYIDLSRLNAFKITGDYQNVIVKEVYPAKMKCNGSVEFATLYVCDISFSKEKILVLDYCSEIDKIIATIPKEELNLIIKKENVISISPTKIRINTKKNILIDDGTKYIFASLTRLQEQSLCSTLRDVSIAHSHCQDILVPKAIVQVEGENFLFEDTAYFIEASLYSKHQKFLNKEVPFTFDFSLFEYSVSLTGGKI